LNPRRILPYAAGLLVLAWALGSLARSGSGGGILLDSYWLLYLVYLLPVFAVGAMVALIVFIAFNWRDLSNAIGFGIVARRRATRKQSRTVQLIVYMAFWGLALMVLYYRCGGIICNTNSTQPLAGNLTTKIVSGSPGPDLPSLGRQLAGLTSIVSTDWFFWGFVGLLAVSSVIIARSFKVSLDETRNARLVEAAAVQEAGTRAVQDALKVLEEAEEKDPRTRILRCYQKMIMAAAALGARVSPDQTARELEKGIRMTFLLKGSGIGELTRLFEEARYSLHPITEEDAVEAQRSLVDIREELKGVVRVEA
jgi:hypothetical protein